MRHFYKVVVEKDEAFSNIKKTPRYMIVIYRGEKETVGYPLRDATKIEAQEARQIAQFAFEYGMKETRELVSDFIYHAYIEVKGE